jgi:hypothetical protein
MNNVELFGQHPEHKQLLKVPEYKKNSPQSRSAE